MLYIKYFFFVLFLFNLSYSTDCRNFLELEKSTNVSKCLEGLFIKHRQLLGNRILEYDVSLLERVKLDLTKKMEEKKMLLGFGHLFFSKMDWSEKQIEEYASWTGGGDKLKIQMGSKKSLKRYVSNIDTLVISTELLVDSCGNLCGNFIRDQMDLIKKSYFFLRQYSKINVDSVFFNYLARRVYVKLSNGNVKFLRAFIIRNLTKFDDAYLVEMNRKKELKYYVRKGCKERDFLLNNEIVHLVYNYFNKKYGWEALGWRSSSTYYFSLNNCEKGFQITKSIK